MMSEKVTIPERHQEFCKAVARLCREHSMESVTITYRPGFGDEWDGDISAMWEQGRHGEDSDRIYISSNVRVHTRLGPPKERF